MQTWRTWEGNESDDSPVSCPFVKAPGKKNKSAGHLFYQDSYEYAFNGAP